jgi:uncharacterized protein (DUF433 family)
MRFFGEGPHVRGRRVPVATIAHCARDQKWSVSELAYQFTLSEAQVSAALLYYEEHKDAIEAQEAEYQKKLDEAYRLHNQSNS